MIEIINKARQYILAQSVGSLILGLFLFFWPNITATLFLYILSGYLAVMGVIGIYTFFKNRATPSIQADIGIGILEIILALIIFFFPYTVATFATFLIGGYLILNGTLNVIRAIEVRNHIPKNWLWIVALNLITILAGIIVIANPFLSYQTFIQMAGIFLIAKGIIDIITYNFVVKPIISDTL
ncbi:MAG: DUF308 domain-containing protein [Erysipelotrichaceae bacterium]